jgi:hypothetical protein
MCCMFTETGGPPKGMRIWTDGTDQAVEGVWRWSGSDMTFDPFANWRDSEPNDANGDEDCLNYWVATGKWNDQACAFEFPFICELYMMG